MFSTEDLVVKYFIEMKYFYDEVLCAEYSHETSIILKKTRILIDAKPKSAKKKPSLFTE